ncbi:MAG: NTE family protein, partial [Candidatus Paceibacteria bacterium]
PLLTGVSAGGINAAHLANHTGCFAEKVEGLVDLWSHLTVEQVFRVDSFALIKSVIQWGAELTVLGGRKWGPVTHGLVDTSPLRDFLLKNFVCTGAELCGIEKNIASGSLRAVALSTTSYETGRTITWCQGRNVAGWERPNRHGVQCDLTIDHVLASSALPLFFPAVQVDGNWYGDGGLRLNAPLAPAVHLGASHVLAISTRYNRTIAEAALPDFTGYPPTSQIAGHLMNGIFLDLLDQDAANLQRINRLLAHVPAAERGVLRPVDLFVVQPSLDLGQLSGEYEAELPGLFRFLTRRLGTKRSRSNDLMSLVMFNRGYILKLIELGEQDAAARGQELTDFIRRAIPSDQ